jgi:hypothetical protein|nr:MAG TPA: hypothetical protein [Caudoviricetes sp.]
MKILKHSYTDITGMARAGFTKDNYEIYVNTDDGGNIPHFHYRLKSDLNKFHTCIRLDSPEYFHHNGKEDVLNSSQKKNLQKFLSSSVTLSRYKGKFENNFELLCFLWDINNSNVQSDDWDLPDYTTL